MDANGATSWMICPECRSGLLPARGGKIRCRKGHSFEVRKGVPYLFPKRGKNAVRQVTDNFSYQWKAWGRFPKAYTEFRKNWFLAKLGLKRESQLPGLLKGCRRVLDAGTGLGYKLEIMAAASPLTQVVGIDISGSVHEARRNTRRFPNVSVVRANIFQLPFPRGSFDLIISDGVLHHTPDARGAFLALAPLLAPGGLMAIHVYKKMGPLREFTDSHIQSICRELGEKEGLRYVRGFTEFGRTLDSLDATVNIKRAIPDLGIQAGRVPLQRLLYYAVFQCHWNRRLSFEQNNLVNFDWFHPYHATRHTPDEVRGWFRRGGLGAPRIPITNIKGVTALGRRPRG